MSQMTKQASLKTETTDTTTATTKFAFKRGKQLTIPFFSVSKVTGESVFIKVLSAMRPSQYQPRKGKGDKDGEENIMLEVGAVNLETGEECNFIVNEVFNRKLTQMQEDGRQYVGVSFELQQLGKRAGKTYNDLNIWEEDTAA
jgi:hypothetical protein